MPETVTYQMAESSDIKLKKNSVILCIDDDPFVLQMLSIQLNELLKGTGILIEFLTDPTLAVGKVEQLQADGFDVKLILTDYVMPKMTGYELIYALRIKYQDLRCILLSGQADKFETRELLELRMISCFIDKPWTLKDMRIALQNVNILQ